MIKQFNCDKIIFVKIFKSAQGDRSLRKKIIILLLILIIALITSILIKFNPQPKSFGNASQEATDVSIVNLIATPEKYNDKLVRIIGVGQFQYEGNGIYLSIEDYNHSITKNALWLNINENILNVNPNELKSFNGKYILIEGVFNSKNTGHLGIYSGSIEKISRIDFWK